MSRVTVVSQSESSRAMANELNDLRERWLIRKQIEAETLDIEPTVTDITLDIDFTNLPMTPEGALDLYNKVLEEVNKNYAALFRLKYRGSKKAKIQMATLQAERVYKCAALSLVKQNLRTVNREAYTNIPKTVKSKPTSSDVERLANITGPDKLIGDAWLLLKQLSYENRVIYSGPEWELIDKMRAWLRSNEYIL